MKTTFTPDDNEPYPPADSAEEQAVFDNAAAACQAAFETAQAARQKPSACWTAAVDASNRVFGEFLGVAPETLNGKKVADIIPLVKARIQSRPAAAPSEKATK